jgi:hypothetical protein
MAAPFDAGKSTISEKQLNIWLADDVRDDIMQVPGIGPAAAKLLAKPVHFADGKVGELGVETTFQLLAKYLLFRGPGVTKQQHNDTFMDWLKLKGIHSHRDGITHAVAEKLSIIIPSKYADETT